MRMNDLSESRLRLEDATDIGPVEWRVANTARGMVLSTPDCGYLALLAPRRGSRPEK